MDADALIALALSATNNEMAVLFEKMANLIADHEPLDGKLEEAMDTAEKFKQCLGRMKLIEEETARIKDANTHASQNATTAFSKREPIANNNAGEPKPIANTKGTPIAEGKSEPVKNNKEEPIVASPSAPLSVPPSKAVEPSGNTSDNHSDVNLMDQLATQV